MHRNCAERAAGAFSVAPEALESIRSSMSAPRRFRCKKKRGLLTLGLEYLPNVPRLARGESLPSLG